MQRQTIISSFDKEYGYNQAILLRQATQYTCDYESRVVAASFMLERKRRELPSRKEALTIHHRK